MALPQKCDLCGAETKYIELHICERGWLCDGCYFNNEPWMGDGTGYNPDSMESC